MKFSWRTEWPHVLVIAAMFVLAAVSYGSAPDQIPVHWNMQGQVDRYGGKFEGVLLLPLIAAFVYTMMLTLPRFDPGRENYAGFMGPYATIRFAVIAVLAVVYALTNLAMNGRPVDMGTVMPLIIGAMLLVIGNLLAKVRPNWFVGIRTPWTLSSKRSWVQTHRAGRWVFIGLGLLFMVSAAVRQPWMLPVTIGIAVAGMLGLVVYSYTVWRSDPDKQPPSGTLPAA